MPPQQRTATPTATREPLPAPTEAEQEVADLLEIGAGEEAARGVLERVPLWFHTFSLDGGSRYTPGVARDHRYRVPALPKDLRGRRVLDVGTFDGFYAFLAEARGARRVVAVDNEQYREWVRARWGVELEGG
jgi:tRNA (mo5U34)-methyltransferase